MRTLATCLVLLALGSGAATAQTAAPAAAPPAATPAPAAPAAAPPSPAAEPAPGATPAPQPAPQEAAPGAPQDGAAVAPERGAVAATDPTAEAERQRREADRARIRLLLARARAERAGLDQGRPAPAPGAADVAAQPEPEERTQPYSPGDAGAAIGIGLSLEFPWHTGDSFDLFSADDVGERFGMWATHDLLAFGDRAFLAAGVGFDIESVDSANLFAGALDTELSATVLYATTLVRYVVADWLQPHARLSLGGQLVRTELELNGTDYSNDGDLPFGSLGAGFTLRTPDRTFESRHNRLAALSFGLMIEAGYTVAAPLEMSIDGPGPDERDIALREPVLADLDRSGPFLRFSLVGRL